MSESNEPDTPPIGPIARRTVFSDADAKPPKFCGHPKKIDKVIRCPVCGAMLIETSVKNWGCPNSAEHTKIKPSWVLVEQILEKLPGSEPNEMHRLLRLLRCRNRWMQKLKATEQQIDADRELQWERKNKRRV